MPKRNEKEISNQVFVLGSLHGLMLKNPQYTLREFIASMDKFRPDIILTEVRVDHSGPVEGSIDGGIEQSIVYAFGKESNIPIVPVDWFNDTFIEAMEKEDALPNPQLEKLATPLAIEYDKKIKTGSYFELQGNETQKLVGSLYGLAEQFGQRLSLKRNEEICKNIDQALLNTHGKRVLVIFGLDHKYFLQEHLGKKGNEIINANDFLTPETFKSYKVSSTLKKASYENVVSAEKLLQKQLTAEVYQGAFKKKLTSKLENFKSWLEAISLLQVK